MKALLLLATGAGLAAKQYLVATVSLPGCPTAPQMCVSVSSAALRHDLHRAYLLRSPSLLPRSFNAL
eukprot:scaffold47533_cov18-Tisochrysis_lutea.AAC.1